MPGRDPANVNPRYINSTFATQNSKIGLAVPLKERYHSALSCFVRVLLRPRSLR